MSRALLLIGLAAAAAETAGDEILLRHGGRLVGDIVRRDSVALVLDVDIGQVTVPLDQIEHIQSGVRTPFALYRDRAARLAADDLDGWMSLALWARASGLKDPARQAFLRVLALDPENAAAHQALGHVRQGERWMTVAEAYRARGYVSYQGRWMTPAEREAKVRQEEAEKERERARRAERRREDEERATQARIRELEARVKEAEARTREAESRTREVEARVDRAAIYSDCRHRRRRRLYLPGETITTNTFTICQGGGTPRLCNPVPVGCVDF
jgi:hypothetical protein